MKLLKRTAMFDGAAATGRGHNWTLEVLIFFPVFAVFTAAESLILTFPLVYWLMFKSPLIDTVSDAAGKLFDGGGFVQYIRDVINATGEIMDAMPAWLYLVQLFATAAGIGVILLFCRVIQKRGPASLGFRRGHVFREYIVGAGVGALLLTATVAISYFTGVVRFEKGNFSPFIWILCLLGYIVQGASEEVLCRGYLMVSIARKNPLWLAVILNSIVFAALHLLNPGVTFLGIFNIFLTGCVLSVYVIKRGNLWGACALHSLWNFTLGNVFGFNVSGLPKMPTVISSVYNSDKVLFNGGQFGLEAGLDETIVMVIALIILLFFVKVKDPTESEVKEPEAEI